MGLGDVKLAFIVFSTSALYHPWAAPVVLVVMMLIAGVWALIGAIRARRLRGVNIAFGPALLSGMWLGSVLARFVLQNRGNVEMADCRRIPRRGADRDHGGAPRPCTDHQGRYSSEPGSPPTRLRPRGTDEVRSRRGEAPRRSPPRPDPGLTRCHRGGQHRMAQMGIGHEPGPGRRGRTRRTGPQRPADPAPPRTCRYRRHAEVRLRRGAPGA